jgi:hypothetical protein
MHIHAIAYEETELIAHQRRVLVWVDLRPEAIDLIAAAMTLSCGPHGNLPRPGRQFETHVDRPSETSMQRAQVMLRE